ncbi:MAG: ABC transporter ATP-binding protein [PVC group bacterium]|nr:ABC transporter ATP-binding protein [PVC group bacterium]
MNNSILTVETITKLFYPAVSFGDIIKHKQKSAVTALKDVSFSLEPGKITGLLGANGAGKTTLLKTISTLILPDVGRIKIKNYSAGTHDREIKSLLGLASNEERSFYWRLTGKQNLEFFSTLYGLDKQRTKKRIDELFSMFKINYQDKRFDTYSAGMKRKFALIRALLHNPEILLLDEPMKSLDYQSVQSLKQHIKELSNTGKTILLATHNIPEAETLCDIFIILDNGQIQECGTLSQLREKTNLQDASLSDIYQKVTKNV